MRAAIPWLFPEVMRPSDVERRLHRRDDRVDNTSAVSPLLAERRLIGAQIDPQWRSRHNDCRRGQNANETKQRQREEARPHDVTHHP
jgi:hypothetical protein